MTLAPDTLSCPTCKHTGFPGKDTSMAYFGSFVCDIWDTDPTPKATFSPDTWGCDKYVYNPDALKGLRQDILRALPQVGFAHLSNKHFAYNNYKDNKTGQQARCLWCPVFFCVMGAGLHKEHTWQSKV